MKSKTIPGLNIQFPWSQLIVNGSKTVETRSYPLPQKHWGKELAIIETPGPKGAANGVARARIIGVVVFESSFQYEGRKHWTSDFERHLVKFDDHQFAFNPDKPKFGWVVRTVIPFEKPVNPPKSRGIIFASKCTVQIV